MAEVKIRRCDRCSTEITDAYLPVTLHRHHERRIDLCKFCADVFAVWLGLDGRPRFSDAYEARIAAALTMPPGYEDALNEAGGYGAHVDDLGSGDGSA